MDTLRRLLLAWDAGEDCYFAIADCLQEMGYPYVAEFHAECGPWKDCNLKRLVRGQKAELLEDKYDSLEAFLPADEKLTIEMQERLG